MNLISKTKFAKSINVSPTYVGKIQDQLTLIEVEGKKIPQIDLHGSATLEYLKKREEYLSEFEPEPPSLETPPPKTKPFGQGNNPSGLPNTGERKKLADIKTEEQIEEIRIKNQIKRADLVQKKTAIKVFNRFYGIHETQLKSIGINAGPKISTVYNKSNAVKISEILKLLEKEDDKSLRTELTKVLNSGESERINSMNQILEDATGSILKSIQIEIDKFLKHVEELKKV